MADVKITALTVLTAADPINDAIPIVDVSDNSMAASGTTKRISINNILACSPSATLASATITGDLTVRTNKLAVTSNGVGIGTATPTAGFALDIQTAAGTSARVKGGSGSGQGSAYYVTLAASASTMMAIGDRANIFGGTPDVTASIYTGSGIPLTFDVGGSTAMTLNSTGLGVGVAPAVRLDLLVADAAEATRFRAASGWLRIHPYLNATDYCRVQAVNGTNTALIPISVEGLTVRLNSNFGNAVTIDSLGNTISNVNSAIPSLGTNRPTARWFLT